MQEILLGVKVNQNADIKKTLQKVQIYIGDDLVYQNNPMCPGGPFLTADDPSNRTTFSASNTDDEEGKSWSVTDETWQNYGKEAWCNMKGRYTSIVADLTGLASEVTLGMSLCNVGIMGSKYFRKTQPPLTIEITVGETKNLTIENIFVDQDPKFEIGNTL